jgi:hypothetical protein
MPDNTDTRPTEGAAIPVNDVRHAPFIFYEGTAVSGFADGVICITLKAGRPHVGSDGELAVNQVVVAYLRSGITAAANLRDALNDAIGKALLAAAPPAGEGKAN